MSVAAPLLRVCVTGPESTGKTVLAQRLAQRGGALWVPEASREYAERKSAPLLESDVSPIAREHITLVDAATEAAIARGSRLLVLDTDLVSTVVYGRHYYGMAPSWVEAEAWTRRSDVYLLCDVDVPWIADGLRDRPAGRHEMLARFQDELSRIEANVTLVTGGWEARWDIARSAVERGLAASR